MTLEQQIREAAARGYCHDENANKVLDPDLINAIVEEVVLTLTPTHPPGQK
jgi:hypothetical protein